MSGQLRVQMVTAEIPAYQNDFDDLAEAVKTAAFLAGGADAARVEHSTDVARFESKSTVVRVFRFPGESHH